MAILNLQESGRIQMLYNKWWKNTGTCSNDEKKQESKASSLGERIMTSYSRSDIMEL